MHKIDTFRLKASLNLGEVFTNKVLRRILEGRGYQLVDVGSEVVAVLADRAKLFVLDCRSVVGHTN